MVTRMLSSNEVAVEPRSAAFFFPISVQRYHGTVTLNGGKCTKGRKIHIFLYYHIISINKGKRTTYSRLPFRPFFFLAVFSCPSRHSIPSHIVSYRYCTVLVLSLAQRPNMPQRYAVCKFQAQSSPSGSIPAQLVDPNDLREAAEDVEELPRPIAP